jgi:hypothetical protein
MLPRMHFTRRSPNTAVKCRNSSNRQRPWKSTLAIMLLNVTTRILSLLEAFHSLNRTEHVATCGIESWGVRIHANDIVSFGSWKSDQVFESATLTVPR